MKIAFRELRADEVDARVSTISAKGLSLLLYKDARCDMNILDETVGSTNWEREHEIIGDRLYCTVSIFDEDKNAWVSKQDVGTESYTEKEKGQASDSFKRACFNWGIGRELYTAPFIWIKDGLYTVTNKGGKPTTYDKFSVESMTVENHKITGLTIKNLSTNKIVYTYGSQAKQTSESRIKKEIADNGMEHYIPLITMQQKQYFLTVYDGKEDKLEQLLKKYELDCLNDMPQKLANQIITKIEGRKRA